MYHFYRWEPKTRYWFRYWFQILSGISGTNIWSIQISGWTIQPDIGFRFPRVKMVHRLDRSVTLFVSFWLPLPLLPSPLKVTILPSLFPYHSRLFDVFQFQFLRVVLSIRSLRSLKVAPSYLIQTPPWGFNPTRLRSARIGTGSSIQKFQGHRLDA